MSHRIHDGWLASSSSEGYKGYRLQEDEYVFDTSHGFSFKIYRTQAHVRCKQKQEYVIETASVLIYTFKSHTHTHTHSPWCGKCHGKPCAVLDVGGLGRNVGHERAPLGLLLVQAGLNPAQAYVSNNRRRVIRVPWKRSKHKKINHSIIQSSRHRTGRQ